MAQVDWKTFEDQVRGIASLIWGIKCEAKRLAGTNFDGVITLNEQEIVAIEISKQNDLDKVRQGIGRLNSARFTCAGEGIVLRGFIVLSEPPSQSMIDLAKDAKVSVVSASQFAMQFFQFHRYLQSRNEATFGSSIDPLTGKTDTIRYIPVKYQQADKQKEYSLDEMVVLLRGGANIILLGEYGSGKSRCVREIFQKLSLGWAGNFLFPYAINLRECWGLDRADEIVRRGCYTLGLDDVAPSAVRAMRRNCLILLLDGFDELGSQSWSTDETRLRQLRARALRGIKDLVDSTDTGCLITGREHYFSSNEEMLSALGLNSKSTLILRAKDQFNDEELEEYFEATNMAVELPTWLPRKPLICQTIALLSDDELGAMFGINSEGVEFWNHFIKVVCERDSRINAFFDPDTIYGVFVALSRITRGRPANIGPVSQRDLQDAFEAVVGQLPAEEASNMLQRLPSLGRIGAESQDRQFIDMFILDGLRAKDIARLADSNELQRAPVYGTSWINPLAVLGQTILSEDIKKRVATFRDIAAKSSASKNGTLAADIISAMCRISSDNIDLKTIKIKDAAFSEFDLSGLSISNVDIASSTFERIILPSSAPTGIRIASSLSSRVSGASSHSGLPAWVHLDLVEEFDSVQTVSQIKRAGLSPAHEILVGILKKTFKQKGKGRKEEALIRGFGSGVSRKLSGEVLKMLMGENILERHPGDEGWIYNPNRSYDKRVTDMLDKLRSSDDEIWSKVDALNK